MKTNVNPHNVGAIVQRGKDVEVRYLDGKDPVVVKGSTTSQVLKDIESLKRQARADSGQ